MMDDWVDDPRAWRATALVIGVGTLLGALLGAVWGIIRS